MKNTAIVLAGGSGSRMKSSIKKQYLLLEDKPILYYSLKVFQDFDGIHEIILVCSREDIEKCRKEIVEKYEFTKVSAVVEGGTQRYLSVYEGLKAVKNCGYVLIHDGARPFVDEKILERILTELPKCQACVAGMPVKDTIKMSDGEGYVEKTIARELLWNIQTPQAFSFSLIREAYDRLADMNHASLKITDDAMVAELTMGTRVKLVEGSYENIKITTPEDLYLAEAILKKRPEKGKKRV